MVMDNEKIREKPSVKIGDHEIGAKKFTLIAGPCAVESEQQILLIAEKLKELGGDVLRGGTYKARTSPYSFQGLNLEGLKLLHMAGATVGLPTITEVIDEKSLYEAINYVDAVQIGTRNMYNYSLLRKIGRLQIPVLLKRGLSATIEEWLHAAEYILEGGNKNVILCERGIRTFETATRNTLDISAVLVLKQSCSLPIIIDPSHACGVSNYVVPLSRAAYAVGSNGIMVEVHPFPEQALSDGPQSINIHTLSRLCSELSQMESVINDFVDCDFTNS